MSWEKSRNYLTVHILLSLLAGAAVPSPGSAAEIVPELHPPEAISAEAAMAHLRDAFAYKDEHLAKAAGSNAAREARKSIEVDLALLAEDPDQMRIELPDGRVYLAIRKVSWTEEGARRYWSGELYGEGELGKETQGTLVLSAEGGIVAGALRAGSISFEIVPLDEGRQQLVPAAAAVRSTAKGASCLEPMAADEAATVEPLRPVSEKSVHPCSVVDVLVVYPSSLATTPTQEMQTRAKIALWFNDANQVLANSGVSHRFAMVYSGRIFGEQPWTAGTVWLDDVQPAFKWLQQTPTPSEIATLQETWKADLVALFIPPDNNVICGIAENANPSTDQFAVIDLGCADSEYLVAHELGHLLGMRHAAGESTYVQPPLYAFAYGYDNDNQLAVAGQPAATVMACNGPSNPTPAGNQCSRIPYYSSPAIQVGGVVIGSATANNAEVARLQMPATAQRRLSIAGNRSPQLTLHRPLGGQAQRGQYLTLSARACDAEDGSLNANIQWSSDKRGYLGSGPLLRVLTPALGGSLGLNALETFTASVRDSGGLLFSSSVLVSYVPQVTTRGAIWHDPGTPGRFLSFNKNMNNEWVATFMTYEGDNPVWYLSGVGPVAANGSFFSPLYRYTRGAAAPGSLTPTTIGYISISVETDRQIRLVITPFSGPPVDLMLAPFTEAMAYQGGFWSEANGVVDAGWVIFRGPLFGRPGHEAKFVATYDGSQPVWAFRIGAPSGSLVAEALLRPTSGSILDNQVPPLSGNVGSLTWPTGSNTASLALTFPSGNVWNRYGMPMVPFSIR